METADTNLVVRIRKNYNHLLFFVTASIPLILWWLFMLLVSFGGTLFDDPNTVGMSIFMVFFFPLIAAPIISGLAILITKLLNIQWVGWLVIIGLGFLIPLVAFVLVLLGHLITRKLHIGDKENIPEIWPRSTKTNATSELQKAAPSAVSGDPADKLVKLKEMLEKSLISQQDYETKKADILSKI